MFVGKGSIVVVSISFTIATGTVMITGSMGPAVFVGDGSVKTCIVWCFAWWSGITVLVSTIVGRLVVLC